MHYRRWPAGNIVPVNNDYLDLRIVKGRSRRQTMPKGVSWDESRKKIQAYYDCDYKRVPLGRFDTLEEAVEARRQAEKRPSTSVSPTERTDLTLKGTTRAKQHRLWVNTVESASGVTGWEPGTSS
jgi:hypothetical protein